MMDVFLWLFALILGPIVAFRTIQYVWRQL